MLLACHLLPPGRLDGRKARGCRGPLAFGRMEPPQYRRLKTKVTLSPTPLQVMKSSNGKLRRIWTWITGRSRLEVLVGFCSAMFLAGVYHRTSGLVNVVREFGFHGWFWLHLTLLAVVVLGASVWFGCWIWEFKARAGSACTAEGRTA